MNVEEVEWPEIDLGSLDWHPIEAYAGEPRLVLLEDADRKIILGEQDQNGRWGESLDGETLPIDFKPVRWAAPTDEIVQAMAFG